jgi:putative addiction module killer protein
MRRLDRLQAGNPGDSRALRSGLMELRIDTGPGYRVHFPQVLIDRCLILCGGSKRTRVTDIERARKWLEESKKRPSR